MDRRPEQCRFRLQDEGKPYPRSGCKACGKTITTGLGTHCTERVTDDEVRQTAREAAEEIRRQRARIEKLEVALNIISSGMKGDKVLADWELSNIAQQALVD